MSRKKLNPEEREYEALLGNLRTIAGTKAGKDIIWHILTMCDIYADGFMDDSRVQYLSGKRAVGLQILGFLEDADPTLYARILLEKQTLKEPENARSSTDTDTDPDA